MNHDIAVVGLGGTGSAILAHCASRGASTIGLEQFQPAHNLGSSHGSRLIRKAYFENPNYVPLVLRAYDLWRALERETGEQLLRITGLLAVGNESSDVIQGTQRAASAHDLPIEMLSRREIKARYSTLHVLEDEVGLFEADGGALDSERAVSAHLRVAECKGAHIRFGAAMERWHANDSGFEISLDDGTQVSARSLVLSLGPWFKETLESLGVPIRVQRNVQVWFSPATNAYNAGGFPAFFLSRKGLRAPLYGFPDLGDGVKIAFHGFGDLTSAQNIRREINLTTDVEPLARALEQWMPGAANSFRAASACMYTLTPDEHFVIDRHPDHRNLILCGGFSGHGFKFASVIGEIGADLALDGGSRHEIGFLSLARFS